MLHYLKERFAEYMMSANSNEKTQKETFKINKEDPYVDFEILYSGTDVIVDSFSMSKKEIKRNFEQSLRRNLSEVLEVNAGNINIIGKNEDIVYCDITYSGKPSEYIKHEVRKIKERPQEKFLVDEDIYNDLDDDNLNPYADGPWGGTDWFCIRCGFMLMPIAPKHTWWGELAWDTMKQHKTQWYLCTNKDCYHFNGPLILHHPTKGWDKPAGDSYSISWVK